MNKEVRVCRTCCYQRDPARQSYRLLRTGRAPFLCFLFKQKNMATSNKYALITGASSGIGYELARLFAKDGYNLVLVARSEEELQQRAGELQREFSIEAISLAKDLFEPEAPFALYEEVQRRGLRIDALVNDAGQGQFGLFAESDIRRQLDLIQLNVSALTALTYLFLKDMIARGSGRILQLGSIASQLPGPWQAVYHATKAYVLSFSEALRSELKDSGIVVTTLQPGATDTDFFNKADMQDSKILDTKLSDPAQVAKDGYDALMSNDDKVVSGARNKMMVGMSNVVPEDKVADMMKKMQEPRDEK
jgi:short-subunit dehydrogenase